MHRGLDIDEIMPKFCQRCEACNYKLAFAMERWVADQVGGICPKRGNRAADVIDSSLFPGLSFQVKVAFSHSMSKKDAGRIQWTWHEHETSNPKADCYILAGVDKDASQIHVFVLPVSVWIERSYLRGKSDRRVSVPAKDCGLNRGSGWIDQYHALDRQDLLKRIGHIAGCDERRFHLQMTLHMSLE